MQHKTFWRTAVTAIVLIGWTSALALPATTPIVLSSAGNPIQATAVMTVDASGNAVAAGGDASAANQTTQITAAQLTNTTLGAVTASPTANTIGDRLKVINTTLGTPFQVGGSIGNTSFASTQSGTWTVQPGNTANTTPWLTQTVASASASWAYAAASGGITNTTTAVTLVGATASMRNYLTSCQVSADALGAATELVIRDGAGGTVLIRSKLATAGLAPTNMVFATPLKSTANTLLEVATLTATITGGVYVNCQGYTAT